MQIRHAFRGLARRPRNAALSSVALGVGIAAVVVGVSLVRGILLRPLPFEDADGIVRLVELDDNARPWWPSFPNIADWREYGTHIFKGVAAVDVPLPKPVIWDGQAQRLIVGGMSRGFLATLGVRPAMGRDFTDAENTPGGAPVALVSWTMWKNQLGGRPLTQLTVTIGKEIHSVIGVLPPDFRFFGNGLSWSSTDVWLPMERSTSLGGRTSHGYPVIARLQPGMTMERAKTEGAILAKTLHERNGEPTQASSIGMTRITDDVIGNVRQPLRVLMIAAFGVLLIACFNVGGTLLAGGLTRERELAVRLSLGARRVQIVMQLITEAAVLALPGAILGGVLSWLIIGLLRNTRSTALPRLDELHMDATTLGLTAAIALASAILAGVLPAIILSSRDLGTRLRGSVSLTPGRSSQRIWSGFIAGQTALALVLLFATALLLRSLVAALAVPLGYDPSNVLAVGVSLPRARYTEPTREAAYYDELLRRVRALPGVTAAGIASVLPTETQSYTASTKGDGASSDIMSAYRIVDAGYFKTLGIPTISGSGPEAGTLNQGDAWIDAPLSSSLWKRASAVGHTVNQNFDPTPLRVVGIVGPVREWQMDAPTPTVYVDYHARADAIQEMNLVVRSSRNMSEVAADVRRTVKDIDAMVPITTAPLVTHVTANMAGRRLILGMVTAFGIVSLFLASIAVYTMVAFAVGRRRREVGIRLTLGARPAQLQLDMLGNVITPAAVGIIIGCISAYPAGALLASQLFKLNPHDVASLTGAALLLAVSAAIAAFIPVRSASRVDPAIVMRGE